MFGGTFDPVHVGHLAAAVEVRHALGLDRVLLVVAASPWQKVGTRPIAPGEDRFAVVSAAVADLDGLEASRLELDREGPSYTADTLEQIARLHPGAELVLVIGSDVAAELHTWERPADVARLASVAVVTRPGTPVVLPPPPWRASAVDVVHLDVSSTDLRARAAAGRPLDVLVPPAAVRVIHRLGLYASFPDESRWDDAGDPAV